MAVTPHACMPFWLIRAHARTLTKPTPFTAVTSTPLGVGVATTRAVLVGGSSLGPSGGGASGGEGGGVEGGVEG